MSIPGATLVTGPLSQQFVNGPHRKLASIDAPSPLNLSDDKSRQVVVRDIEARGMHKQDDCIQQLGSLDMISLSPLKMVDGEKSGTNKILGRRSHIQMQAPPVG